MPEPRLRVARRISIHAPRAGSDRVAYQRLDLPLNFNPRSPCGERRSCRPLRRRILRNFNPRSPCGERHDERERRVIDFSISIHAPRAGSDDAGTAVTCGTSNFNPRSPCGERRIIKLPHNHIHRISIHAPRAGSDFSARSWPYRALPFQSTLPVRGATANCNKNSLQL